MRAFEFAVTPQTSSEIKDLKYLLNNADINQSVLQKALNFLKKNSEKTQNVNQQPKNNNLKKVQFSVNDPQIKEQSSDNNLKNEIIKFAEAADPSELEKIIYYIKLDAFKSMASDVIKSKIKVKAAAITEQIHLAIGDLAGKISVESMTDFLNDCKDGGVIDATSMISDEQENLKPIPISRNDYLPIVKRLLETNLGGASASGKGEFGLAFAGINATKGEKDITISGVDVEVKATQRNKDFFFKGQTGFELTNTKAALSKLVDALNSVGGNFQNSNEVGKGGIAQLNPKTLEVLNPYFIKLGQTKVADLLKNIISEIYKDHDISKFSNDITSSVNSDGSINYSKLLNATSKISFYYYQQIEKHPGVLMLNITNATYVYQKNPEDFANLVATGVVSATSAVDFRTSTKGSLTFKVIK